MTSLGDQKSFAEAFKETDKSEVEGGMRKHSFDMATGDMALSRGLCFSLSPLSMCCISQVKITGGRCAIFCDCTAV